MTSFGRTKVKKTSKSDQVYRIRESLFSKGLQGYTRVSLAIKKIPDNEVLRLSLIHIFTRVKDKRRAASTRAGGVGERYTCVVDGKEIFLFYEDNNMWFMERAGA